MGQAFLGVEVSRCNCPWIYIAIIRSLSMLLPILFSMIGLSTEVDCHLVCGRVEKGIIATPFVSTGTQLANIFTKSLCRQQLELLCNKLGLSNIYSLA